VTWVDALFGRSPVVTAALESSAEPTFAVDIPAEFFGLTSYTDPIGPAPRISRREAIQCGAVKKSRDLICGSIGGLPLTVVDTDRVTMVNDLLDQPERNIPRSVTMTRTVEDVLFEGIAWWRVTERGVSGFPSKVVRLDPLTVVIQQDQKVYYRRDGQAQGSALEYIPDADLIRFDSPNDALLIAGARAIRSALRLDSAAANSAADPIPQGYFQPADDADPVDDEDIAQILTDWRTARQNGSTGYVPAALKYVPLQWDSKQLQLTEGRAAAVLEIARHAGVDPTDLGVSVTTRDYTNHQDDRKDLTDFTLGNYLHAIEDRLSMGDVTQKGHVVRFNLDAFMRSSTLERYQAYEVGERVGAITRDEIREDEGKPALPASEAPVPAPAASQFADPDVITFDAPAAPAQFKVDLEARTITGLAVPYGQVAESKGRKWSFSKGSLQLGDPSRTKFLDGHDWAKPLGRAIEFQDTDAGLLATFKVSATPAGDEALLLAADQVKDGLSIGIGQGGTYQERDGVYHATSAPLPEISLTPCPAFDDARVHAVTASKEGTEMKCTKCDRIHAAGVVECDAVALAAFTASQNPTAPQFSAAQLAQIQALLTPAPAATPAAPEVIAAGGPQLQVTEPLPYRFDGLKGEHDFSSDLFSVAKRNDAEAGERIEKFMAAAFAVTGAGVATLTPNINRPDLYVDQLDYSYPVWTAINKGGLTDGTPFVLPKFSTASGLVADHTEGVAPSAGTFTATSQTITPTATSGRVEVPREVVDAGGNPQVSGLIWRQVVRAYYEALEAKAVALLDGLTPTSLATLGVGDADAVLASKLESGLASLHFLRGGDRFDKLVIQEDLYKALIAAKDSAGRKLYPVINPTNANGQVAANFGQIMIGGKVGVPAWALGASGVVAESSYLFASEDVHGWATPPQRFDFEYRVEFVDIAVWGYKALANTRLAGVYEISYDPA
jgi:HK97 family phage prohead protease